MATETQKDYNKTSGQDIKKSGTPKREKRKSVYIAVVYSLVLRQLICSSDYCRKKNRQIKEYQSEIKRGNNVNIDRLLNEQKEYQLKVKTDEIEKTI